MSTKTKRVPKIEYWRSAANNQWYFHVRGGNGRILVASEGYQRRNGATNAISVFITNGFRSHVTEVRDPLTGSYASE